jgi:hypothetical protein
MQAPGAKTSRWAHVAFAALTAGLLVGALADGSLALSDFTFRVEATANPWAAGQADPPSIGTLPAEIVVPEGKTNVFFPLVTGSWSNTGAMFSADGERPAAGAQFDCGGPPPCTVLGSNGLSGLIDAARFWYLTGVFIGPGTPAGSPPPSIDFTLRHEFTVLKPELGQVFFIGDGRAADGDPHLFRVPPGSTRLFLGMVDICAPGETAGCYYDNSGSLEVTTSWGSTPDTATLPAPAVLRHDSNWVLLTAGGAITFLTALRLRCRAT